MKWCGLIAFVGLGTLLRWGDGRSLRVSGHSGHSSQLPVKRWPQPLTQEVMNKPTAEEKKIQLCSATLYKACLDPTGLSFMRQRRFRFKRSMFHTGRDYIRHQNQDEINYGKGIQRNFWEGESSHTRRKKNIVEACCKEKCTFPQFMSYCSREFQNSRRTHQQHPATTTRITTTTTTPPPRTQEPSGVFKILWGFLCWGMGPQCKGESQPEASDPSAMPLKADEEDEEDNVSRDYEELVFGEPSLAGVNATKEPNPQSQPVTDEPIIWNRF